MLFVSLAALLNACTDAATRIAYQIEESTQDFQNSPAQKITINHLPKSLPEGCSSSYTLQFSKNSSLVIWCKSELLGKTTASYGTTYHLRFVKVPETLVVDKREGEAALIDLEKQNGQIILTGLR